MAKVGPYMILIESPNNDQVSRPQWSHSNYVREIFMAKLSASPISNMGQKL
jgi:hypothetical protein